MHSCLCNCGALPVCASVHTQMPSKCGTPLPLGVHAPMPRKGGTPFPWTDIYKSQSWYALVVGCRCGRKGRLLKPRGSLPHVSSFDARSQNILSAVWLLKVCGIHACESLLTAIRISGGVYTKPLAARAALARPLLGTASSSLLAPVVES